GTAVRPVGEFLCCQVTDFRSKSARPRRDAADCQAQKEETGRAPDRAARQPSCRHIAEPRHRLDGYARSPHSLRSSTARVCEHESVCPWRYQAEGATPPAVLGSPLLRRTRSTPRMLSNRNNRSALTVSA